MWMLIALALAEPVWTNGETQIRMATVIPVQVLHSPAGSRTVSEGYGGPLSVERVLPSGSVDLQTVDVPAHSIVPMRESCDFDGDGADDLLMETFSPLRNLSVVDVETGQVIRMFDSVGSGRFIDALCVDIDSDSHMELIAATDDNIVHIWDRHGGWISSDVQGPATVQHLAAGQLDTDPTMEVVFLDGRVFEPASRTLEVVLDPAVSSVQLYDVDGDGVDEMWARTRNGHTMRDVDGTVLWRLHRWYGASRIGDFDGDGHAEVVIGRRRTRGTRTVHATFDARTGQQQGPSVTGRTCDRWQPHDHDGDGQFQLMCLPGNGDLVIDPSIQTVELLAQHATTSTPMSGDLDGDGTEEVLWVPSVSHAFAGTFVLRDARGALLDVLPTGSSGAALYDYDGDGDDDVLIGNQWWNWSSATGFVRAAGSDLRTSQHLCLGGVFDLDHDGRLEILDRCGTFGAQLVDLANGSSTPLPGTFPDEVYARDMDGDGVDELFSTTGFVRRDGTLVPNSISTSITHMSVVTHPAVDSLVVNTSHTLDIYTLPDLSFVGSLPFSNVWGMWSSGGQLWFTDGMTHSWTPTTGLSRNVTGSISGPIALADGVLWWADQSVIHGMDTP